MMSKKGSMVARAGSGEAVWTRRMILAPSIEEQKGEKEKEERRVWVSFLLGDHWPGVHNGGGSKIWMAVNRMEIDFQETVSVSQVSFIPE